MTKYTNISKGPRGLNTKTGTIIVNAGETVDAELSEGEAKSLSKEWWGTGAKAAKAAAEETPQPNGGEGDNDGEGDGNGGETSVYKAVHRGAGSFSIVDGDGKEVIEKITKAEAEKFNKLSDEEKTEYVLANAAE